MGQFHDAPDAGGGTAMAKCPDAAPGSLGGGVPVFRGYKTRGLHWRDLPGATRD